MNLLFVCSRNRLRSPTAEVVFSTLPDVTALSAGTSPDAETPLSGDLIAWADLIFVMENQHRRRLNERFSAFLKQKKIIVLGIADRYSYMDPELVRLLETQVSRHLRST